MYIWKSYTVFDMFEGIVQRKICNNPTGSLDGNITNLEVDYNPGICIRSFDPICKTISAIATGRA